MKRTKRGAFALLLTLCVTLGLLPALTPAASAADNVTYLDANGAQQTAASATEVTAGSTAWNAGWYVVNSDVTITSRVTVTGDVHLILADGANLTASAGITVTGSNSLTIYAQSEGDSMGKLSATGGKDAAGIGGGASGAGGTITVNGGAVTANGGAQGAGIGGGRTSSGGAITVNGGAVTANGGIYGAGIGGGYKGASGAISITGGTVTANGNVGGTSDDGGAGIGGGEDGNNSGDGNSISITGGTVTATVPNGTKGAAIGNGGGDSGTDVTVTISADLKVKAGAVAASATLVTDVANTTSYKYARVYTPRDPAVSYLDWDATNKKLVEKTGDDARDDYTLVTAGDTKWNAGWYVADGKVTISNRVTVTGDVRLILKDSAELTASAGITVTGSNKLTIYAQSEGDSMGKLSATGGDNAAGIGGGDKGAGGTITINGGAVTANGGNNGAGIGGGGGGTDGGAGGTITVNGGTVTATGGTSGAGIGGGGASVVGGAGGTITVNGGAVTANSGKYGAGIGGGYQGASGASSITGGTVNANGNVGGSSDDGGAGIGGGEDGVNSGDGNSISITGGTVTATVPNGTKGAAIGNGGGDSGTDVTVTIGVGLTVGAGTSADGTGAKVVTDVANNTNYKYAKIPFHKHSFDSYQLTTTNAPDDTITATCTANDCSLTDQKATLTISAPAEGGGAAVLDGDADAFGVSASDIQYFRKSGADWAEISGTPGGSGFFKGSLTIASSYTIEAAYGVNAITVASGIENGAITAPPVATVGAVVPLTITPDPGYELDTLSPTKTSGGAEIAVSKDEDGGQYFIMPDEEVTVNATFKARNVSVQLQKSENAADEEVNGAAALFNDSYEEVKEGETLARKQGQTFILSVACDDAYDFTLEGSTPFDFSNLSDDETKAYIEKNGIARTNTRLFKVTMPVVASGDLTITVTFKEIKPYTVIYTPTNQADSVWCKVSDANDRSFQLEMSSAATMNDKQVFSLSVSMPDDPAKVAFAASSDAFDSETMTDVQLTTTLTNQKEMTVSGGTCLVVSGNVKVAVAVFVNDINNLASYNDEDKNVTGDGTGATYKIALCEVGETSVQPGTVKAPAALTKEGFTFAGWRGFEGTAPNVRDKTYKAGDTISIRDNTIFNAVWEPVTLSVTIDSNGGTGGDGNKTLNYKDILNTLNNPQKNNFLFNGWTVGTNVTENGVFFSKNSLFDLKTPITADLNLKAQWKHVHSYACVPLNYSGFNDALSDYYDDYLRYIHVKFCALDDIQLETHTFNNGVCTGCGYTKPGSTEVKLDVSYWKDGASNAWMQEFPRTVKKDNEVTVSAYAAIGDYHFSKWQYSTDSGATWEDLVAATTVGFIIPCSMRVRALYVNDVKPQVSLSARSYEVKAQGYLWDSVLFQMEYKLPDNCEYVDAGIRMGDNAGIAYYEVKEERTGAIVNLVNEATDFILSGPLEFGFNKLFGEKEKPKYVTVECKHSVLKEMSAATLSQYMYENKPVNMPKFDPIYWQANPTSKGRSGSVNTLTPLRFIQKDNGKHYIYGIAYLRYKTQDGATKAIYTDALPVTRDSVPTDSVKIDSDTMITKENALKQGVSES